MANFSTSIVFSNSETLDIELNEELLKKYVKLLNIEVLKSASLKQKKQLFLLFIRDFKKGKISLDQLSAFGDYVDEFPNDDDSPEFLEYKSTTFAASELNFSLRRITKLEDVKNCSFASEMLKVMQFYNKNKYLIENLQD